MHLAITNALDWAKTERQRLNALDPRNYRVSYEALIRLFATHVRLDDYHSVVAGGAAAYGWMPTTFRGVDEDQWDLAQLSLQVLAKADTWEFATEAIAWFPEVMRLINGSLVGTSKFMHFLNPRVMPMWDANVAACFGYTVRTDIERLSNYLGYGNELHATLRSGIEYPPEYRVFAGRSLTAVRQLELLLFLYGRESIRPNRLAASD